MDTRLWTGLNYGYWIMDRVKCTPAWILDYGQGLKYPSMDTGLWIGFKVSQHGYWIMISV